MGRRRGQLGATDLTQGSGDHQGRGRAGAGSLPAGVVEGFEGSEIPPRGGKAILQKLPAALARGLEQLYVTS